MKSSAERRWPSRSPSGRAVFSPVYVAMVRAGEAGGFLPIVLQQIADFRTRDQELKGKIKAAMVYPCVLAVPGDVRAGLLMTFFIPRFSTLFEEFGSKLPYLTQIIVAIQPLADALRVGCADRGDWRGVCVQELRCRPSPAAILGAHAAQDAADWHQSSRASRWCASAGCRGHGQRERCRW
jgi:hypothetical protein